MPTLPLPHQPLVESLMNLVRHPRKPILALRPPFWPSEIHRGYLSPTGAPDPHPRHPSPMGGTSAPILITSAPSPELEPLSGTIIPLGQSTPTLGT